MDIPSLLILLLRLYEMILFMRIILSWVSVDYDNIWVKRLMAVTDPVLQPARELIMRLLDRFNVQLPIDLSPILVFVLLEFLQTFLKTL
ncbi:MAG: hypothetical protein A2293_01925 [Elusimicrobia bacterium RIFOXYB2_FULL_49_7]|nr:MAG: hypothetical protein A2293_01925 [Elusimicrobia bacterium RIFOXYB2_FULL_49_7]